MLDIYDDIHDELKATKKVIEKEKDKNEALQCEIKDLQAEFEFERVDYLDSIRRLEKELAWNEEILKRVHPTLRRDCNFANLDRIRVSHSFHQPDPEGLNMNF